MTAPPQARPGGRLLVDALAAQGVDTVFCVPGESYLPVLDALHDALTIRTVVCRQEGGAAMMAEAWGKLTGTPGIVFATRGPGATNASAGIHVARQDSTPMILFVGQVPRSMVDREAFQEIDYRRMFGPLAKWVAQIDDTARIPEYVSRAFHTAVSGRPGPVVLALPEDVLEGSAAAITVPRHHVAAPAPSDDDMRRLRELLERAERPLVLVGGGGWDSAASDALARFAEANGLPVTVSFRRQDYLDNRHPNYAGHVGLGIDPDLERRLSDADLLLAVGTRLAEMTTGGYRRIEVPVPRRTLVHVHPDPSELGRTYFPTLPIVAGSGPFLAAAARMPPVDAGRHAGWTAAARSAYERYRQAPVNPGPVQMPEIVAWLDRTLPEDAIVTSGAGNFAAWVQRGFRFKGWKTQLAPTSGSMGYGLPAAIAARLRHPDRTVVCFEGDGGFLMTGQEFATACLHRLPVIVLVVDNGMYGTIRMHQERTYPGRVSGTLLHNPDFARLAEAHGGHGETVKATAEFVPAFERAVASGKPAILWIRLDPEALTPDEALSTIRERAARTQ